MTSKERRTMAEAMLEDSSFRSSHQDLEACCGNDDSSEKAIDDYEAKLPHNRCENGFSSRAPWDGNSQNRSVASQEDEKKSAARRVEIQLPPKRQKMAPTTFAIGDIIQALNASTLPYERVDAIHKALATFDHTIQHVHDEEIGEKADVALTKHLVFLEVKASFRRKPLHVDIDDLLHEISMTFEALEMVYRASSDKVAVSFSRVGVELLQVLITIIDWEILSRIESYSPDYSPPEERPIRASLRDDSSPELKNEGLEGSFGTRSETPTNARCWSDSPERDTLLKKATKIVGHFARVQSATRTLANFPGLLSCLLNLVNVRPYDAVPWEARLSCLWTIANLACNPENMKMMMNVPDMINSLVSIGSKGLLGNENLETAMEVLRSRSITSRALGNLSHLRDNATVMTDNLALVQAMRRLSVQRQLPQLPKSKTVDELMIQTRRNALGCLKNLASCPRQCKINLCNYGNGQILDTLTDAALNDTDEEVRNLAIATIHSLANHDTAETMVSHPSLVLAIKNIMSCEENEGDKDRVDTPKHHASSTLMVLERSITPEMSSYENLRDLLEAVNPATEDGMESEAMDDDLNENPSAV